MLGVEVVKLSRLAFTVVRYQTRQLLRDESNTRTHVSNEPPGKHFVLPFDMKGAGDLKCRVLGRWLVIYRSWWKRASNKNKKRKKKIHLR